LIINVKAQYLPVENLIREIIEEVMFQIFSAKQLWGRDGRIITYS
jgi:hypothetical protein